MKLFYSLCLSSFLILSCTTQPKERVLTNNKAEAQNINLHDSFNSYWYNGEAELNTYRLEQARYGDIHEGNATMIFVSEPFSRSKQVKLDQPQNSGADKVNVLKLNFLRKFNTGIYPYATMLSNFQPIEEAAQSPALKNTFSAQEWCGQTYFQLNHTRNFGYDYKAYSYFESEGDMSGTVSGVYLEDALWNLLRIQPDALPLGKIKLLPAASFLRLRHQAIKAYVASTQMKALEGNIMEYTIDYNDAGRKVQIRFQKNFPHKIMSWEEEVRTASGKPISTKASLMASVRSPYWERNSKNDRNLRTQLQLPADHQ